MVRFRDRENIVGRISLGRPFFTPLEIMLRMVSSRNDWNF